MFVGRVLQHRFVCYFVLNRYSDTFWQAIHINRVDIPLYGYASHHSANYVIILIIAFNSLNSFFVTDNMLLTESIAMAVWINPINMHTAYYYYTCIFEWKQSWAVGKNSIIWWRGFAAVDLISCDQNVDHKTCWVASRGWPVYILASHESPVTTHKAFDKTLCRCKSQLTEIEELWVKSQIVFWLEKYPCKELSGSKQQ